MADKDEKMNNNKQSTNNADNKKKKKSYKFEYLSKPYSYFKDWVNSTPDFLKFGNIEYFYGMLCPVSTASVTVLERANAEYDTIELTILKLYDAGIKDSRLISLLMGISQKMVNSILNILKNTYHHIDNGTLTEEGRKSLADERNIQLFETTKQVQFEALTGTLLVPSLFQTMSGIEAYYDQINTDEIKRFLPRHYIEKDIRNDLKEHLDDHRAKGTVGRNVEKIISVNVDNVKYTEAFLIKYSFLEHPFLIFPVKGTHKIFWNPVAISKSCEKTMLKHNLAFKFGDNYVFDAVVRPDKEFEPLLKIENDFNLKNPKNKLSKNYSLKRINKKDGDLTTVTETFFEVVPNTIQGAELGLHPDSPYTPVYCIKVDEKEYEYKKEAKK